MSEVDEMTDFYQLSVFDIGKEPFKIDKPIRLIELFAGIGSQAKALERLGADFEHYRVCEFDKYAIKSYNAIHNTDFATSDITQITADDLGIVDTDKYCYILTYSFPCQDLSLAGKQKGMAKGENTRSGLLWEVERLLNECEELPQVLLMENVTQVHGTGNVEHFAKWIEFLESKGYSCYWKDLNAKNFGVPQNRDRCFMVSVLGEYTYEFPREIPLKLRLKDMLEDSVDEKYYLGERTLNFFFENTKKQEEKGNGFKFETTDGDTIAKSITTRAGSRMDDNFIEEQPILIGGMQKNQSVKTDGISTCLTSSMGTGGGYVPMVTDKCIQVGMLSGGKWDKLHDISRRVYSGDGVAPTIHTSGGGQQEPKVLEPTINKIDIPQTVRVRKYEVDTDRLCKILRQHKAELRLSNQHIAKELYVPVTKVEHWFRQDDCFAIPDADVWLVLKTMLGIKTDEFDDAIMTFEEKEGVFEKSNRCYIPDGLAPTITSASADEKIIEPQINVVGNYSPSGHDASRVVDTFGLAPTVKENQGTVTAIAEPLAYDEQNGYIRTDGTVGTLTTDGSSPKHNNRVIEDLRIRKLTPRECYRLMGFDDADFDKAAQHNSNAQLYKQAGNSIVVDVLAHIFTQML